MLLRGGSPQNFWGEHGEPDQISGTEFGLQDIFTDIARMEKAIEDLLQKQLIISSESGLRCSDSQNLRIDDAALLYWKRQAFLLVCFAFPRDSYLELLFASLGRSQLVHLQLALSYFSDLEDSLSQDQLFQFTLVLLSGSRFGNCTWKIKALSIVRKLLERSPNIFLSAALKGRETTLYRSINFEVGDIGRFISELGPRDKRLNAQVGEILINTANHLLEDNDISKGLSNVYAFSPLDCSAPSTLEKLRLAQRDITIGRSLRYQGYFSAACAYLRSARASGLPCFLSTAYSLVCHQADVYCELGKADQAEKLIRTEIDSRDKLGWQNTNVGRRLQLSLAEIQVYRRLPSTAYNIYRALQTKFEALQSYDNSAKLGYLRTMIGLAQTAHIQYQWDQAYNFWTAAMQLTLNYGWDNSFFSMIILFSLADVSRNMGKDFIETKEKAQRLYSIVGRQYWVLGLGTSWLDFMISRTE